MEYRQLRTPTLRMWRTAGVAVALTGVTLAGSVSAAIPAGASPKSQCLSGAATKIYNKLTCRGLSFYRGQTVTLISPDAPGGGFDQWARPLAPKLAEFLGAAGVNVVNVSTASGIPGMDQTAHSTPNGLTIGFLNSEASLSDTYIFPSTGFTFNPQHVDFIGAVPPQPTVWLRKPTSTACPYTDLKSVVAATTNAPNSATDIDVPNSTADIWTRLGNLTFGIKARLITGYSNSTTALAGFVRGDGCFDNANLSTASSLIVGGQAVPLYVWPKPLAGSSVATALAGTPTLAQELKIVKPKYEYEKQAEQAIIQLNQLPNRIMFAPTKTPTTEVMALQAAMKWAMAQGSVISTVTAEGSEPGFVTGAASKADFLKAIAIVKRIAKFM